MASNRKKRGKRTAVDGTVWTGNLADPIKISGPAYTLSLLSPSQEEAARAEQQYQKRLLECRLKKMSLLFARFGIDPNAKFAWQVLAVNLAITCIPGFQIAGKPGAPRKNNDMMVCQLVFDLMHASGLSANAACGVLARQKKLPAGTSAQRARKIYSSHPWRRILEDAAKWDELKKVAAPRKT